MLIKQVQHSSTIHGLVVHTYEFYGALRSFSIILGPDEGQTAFCGCILYQDQIRRCRNLRVQIGRCRSPGERMLRQSRAVWEEITTTIKAL